MKPANAKARALLQKLQALADPANNGAPGEVAAAQRKLAWLVGRFDFDGTSSDNDNDNDIFSGLKHTKRKGAAAHVYTFKSHNQEVANSVKWAIETATGISCLYRGQELLAQTTRPTANRLAKVADHIALNFTSLLGRLAALEGVTEADRSLFVRGLYDGMMNESREGRLPERRAKRVKGPKPKKGAIVKGGLAVHPYSLALSLGRQVRFAAPLDQISAELDSAIRPALSQ